MQDRHPAATPQDDLERERPAGDAPAAPELAEIDLTDALGLDDDEIAFLASTGC